MRLVAATSSANEVSGIVEIDEGWSGGCFLLNPSS
jgi:hypothetical protein